MVDWFIGVQDVFGGDKTTKNHVWFVGLFFLDLNVLASVL